MRCEDCLRLLEPYFDGELPRASAAVLAAHLERCGPCSKAHEALGDELALYLQHRCDVIEAPPFWDELLPKLRAENEARVKGAPGRLRRRLATALSALAVPRFSPTATAALLTAAVCLTIAVMKYAGERAEAPAVAEAPEVTKVTDIPTPFRPHASEGPAPLKRQAVEPGGAVANTAAPDTSAAATRATGGRARASRAVSVRAVLAKNEGRPRPASAGEGGAEKLVREAEQRYLAAIGILSRDVGRRRTRLDQRKLAEFDRTLAVIDRAINETRAAAREHPRDPRVVQYMLTAYAKKVEVLREMAQD